MEMENKPKKSNKKLWLGIIAVVVVLGIASVQSGNLFQGMLMIPDNAKDQFSKVPKFPKFTEHEFKESECDLYIGKRIKYELDGKVFLMSSSEGNGYIKNHNKLKIEDLIDGCQLKNFRFLNSSQVPEGVNISSGTGQLTYNNQNYDKNEFAAWTVEQGVSKTQRSNMVYKELSDNTYEINVIATDGGGTNHAVLPVEITLSKLPQSPRDGQDPNAKDGDYGAVSMFAFSNSGEYLSTSNPLELTEGDVMTPRIPLTPTPSVEIYTNDHIHYPSVNVYDVEVGSKFGIFPLLPSALAVDNNNGEIYNQIAPNLNEAGCREHLAYRISEGVFTGDGFINNNNSSKATDVIQQYVFTVCFE